MAHAGENRALFAGCNAVTLVAVDLAALAQNRPELRHDATGLPDQAYYAGSAVELRWPRRSTSTRNT